LHKKHIERPFALIYYLIFLIPIELASLVATIKLVTHSELTAGHEHEHVRAQSPNDGTRINAKFIDAL